MTINQPFASMVAAGIVTVIPRRRNEEKPRRLAGEQLAIHAARKLPHRDILDTALDTFPGLKEVATRKYGLLWTLPLGAVVGVVTVDEVRDLVPDDHIGAKALIRAGSWGLIVSGARVVAPPVECLGKQKVWDLEVLVELEVKEILR